MIGQYGPNNPHLEGRSTLYTTGIYRFWSPKQGNYTCNEPGFDEENESLYKVNGKALYYMQG